jgi:hypothetical protein
LGRFVRGFAWVRWRLITVSIHGDRGVAARLNCFGEQVYQRQAFRLGQIEWQNALLREVIGFKT